MKLRLSDWASVAEITSGAAVVITLIFLVLEIRENTDAMRATAYERNLQTVIDMRTVTTQDPEVARLFFEAQDENYRTLSPIDQQRAIAWFGTILLAYEKAYYSQIYGLIGEVEYERFDRLACRNLLSQLPEVREAIFAVLTEQYIDHLRSECADPK